MINHYISTAYTYVDTCWFQCARCLYWCSKYVDEYHAFYLCQIQKPFLADVLQISVEKIEPLFVLFEITEPLFVLFDAFMEKKYKVVYGLPPLLIQIPLKYDLKDPIISKSVLVKVMDWRWTDDTPLFN